MKTILIRTLGGKGIGYGHFYRCLSLAKAIKLTDKNTIITFLINKELECLLENVNFESILSHELDEDFKIIDKLNIDLFIFDSYLGNDDYLKKVKELTKVMLIDDNNDIYDSSIPDILYNGNIHAEKLKYQYTKNQIKLLGSKYLIMKEEYWNEEKEDNLDKEGILITTGGTDDYGITIKIMNEIKDLAIKIKVIIGPGYRDDYIKKIEDLKTDNIELVYRPNSLKDYINSSKFVITAGGSTVYEVLSEKSIPVIFSIADNQDLICKELEAIGVGYLGKYPEINYNEIRKIVGKGIDGRVNDFDYEEFSLDGNGACRIAKQLIGFILEL